MRTLLVPALGGLLALGATAQTTGRHVFDIDSAASGFMFSGNVTFQGLNGAIVGNPATFNPSGASSADIGITPTGIANGAFVTGNGTIVTVPTLNARIPNPIPFLPDLATIQVTGATIVFRSVDVNTSLPQTFSVSGAGAFTTGIVADMLSGTATVTGTVNQTISLAGITSTPQAVNGTLTTRPDGVRLNVPLNLNLQFMDPQIGVSGALNLVGTLVANDRMFAEDETTISIGAGGTQVQRLSAGSMFGGRAYFVLGSSSGTSPGISANGVTIPVNYDGFTSLGLSSPNMLPYVNNFGVLDARGLATASFTLPAIPVMLNLPVHHAYGVFNGSTLVGASNAIPLTITP